MITEDSDGTYVRPGCRSTPSIMRELGHDRIDFIKLNIERDEGVVLDAMLAAGDRPAVETLTWEDSGAFSQALSWTRRPCEAGYRFVARREWFFTDVRNAPRPSVSSVA